MIVIAAALVAGLSPAADFAMLDWIGIGVIRRRRAIAVSNARRLSEIRRIVGEAILLRLKLRPRRDDIHVFGRKALHAGQQVGIETELQNRPGFRFACELGIDRLIGPAAQRARYFDAA